MKIGLFFGSFNPIHTGHLIIANFMAQNTDLDRVWLVVTPHNPHKKKKSLARDYDRLHLARIAIENNPYIEASSIEFGLPKPSYTIDTLTFLKEKYPDKEFALIMGGDNLATFHKWKNYEQILADYSIYVYKRPGYELGEMGTHRKVQAFEAPMLDISATYIRTCLKAGQSIRYMVPDPVFDYLENSTMYR